jgi:GNAT superfamily N-acetyltransferase
VLAGLLGGERRGDPALGDPGDLGSVEEPHPFRRVDHDPVEDVLALGLVDAADLAELDAVGGVDGGPAPQDLERDRVAVVFHAASVKHGGRCDHPKFAVDGPHTDQYTFEFRRERLDGRAGRRLVAAFHEEIVRIYPFWNPAVGPTADPHEFEPPDGTFLIVYSGDEPVGCGGFKRLDVRTAEVKRMFVAQQVRSRGVGRRILEQLESGAREAGYEFIRLDTGNKQPEALQLYRSAGYEEIPDYNGNPAASYWFEKPLLATG